MSQTNNEARLFAVLKRDRRQAYILIKRGKLMAMRVKMSEAIGLANSLVDITEKMDGDRQ